MRSLILSSILFLSTGVYSQSFHFNDTVTVLVKNVTQSPAHWYIEVFNDVGVDTTLRWKASLSDIPSQWNISFDDQDNYYPTVNDGDSADFTLFAGLSFPQKLIIGADFNGVSGNKSAFFDVYDPNNLSNVVTIEYRFIVAPLGLEEVFDDNLISYQDNQLLFDQSLAGGSLQIIALDGRLIYEGEIANALDLKYDVKGTVVLKVQWENKFYTRQIFMN